MTGPSKKIFILLSIGANLGQREESIKEAFELLKYSGVVFDAKISSYYETEPVGMNEEPWFINAAISGYTILPLNYLIQFCKSIEYFLGRRQREKWTSRELDIDIIFYGNDVLQDKNLTVPHELMHTRRFVLKPAAELAGGIKHPKMGLTINELLEQCEDTSIVRMR